jgi:thioredoxin-dependent peroxiredoxin
MDITLRGKKVQLAGDLPRIGHTAPKFTLTDSDCNDRNLSEFLGKNLILNVFPSIDTNTCAASTKAFNEQVKSLPNTLILCISMDLPFANQRFCQSFNVDQVILLSDFRNRSFGQDYGLTMMNGPLAGLLARAVILIDPKGVIRYQEVVPELVTEPNYAAVTKYCS